MNETNLGGLTIAELAPRIERREISPVELTRQFLARIERMNPVLNAYMTLMTEKALGEAKKAEQEIGAGRYRGPLHGIPFSIKDNLAVDGAPTTAGSKVLSDYTPDFEATVVKKLKEAGAVILGKANMHEWAAGSTNINPYYGTTRNPWDVTRVPGGSSGGSGAAVAASLCMASIGTDSAGSVRNPASFCGVVGLKATYGRVSRFGGIAGTGGFSTDHFGILTKTVEDAALVLGSIAGHDPRDPLSARERVPDYSADIGKEVRGLRFGIIEELFADLMTSEVKKALDKATEILQSLGMKSQTISVPHMELSTAVHAATSRVENASAHRRYLKTQAQDYSRALLHRQLVALTIPAETYVTAQRIRRILCQEFAEVLKRVDVIVTPTVPMPAPTIEECERGSVDADGKTLPLRDWRGSNGILCTLPFNVTGHPAISVGCGFSSSGLPMGMQIVAAPFREDLIFQVAHAYERAAGWYRRLPPELSP